ncbi:MAG: VanZ family protein [Ignavibacteria bacterium]|nr:VanZ family protein [Ignavibacteria bacterium]
MTLLDKISTKRRLYVYLPLVLYWLIIFIGTSIPGGSIPSIGVSDKFKHFAAYFILTIMLSIAFSLQEKLLFIKKHVILSSLFVASSYGVIDEIHQSFIPGRSCDLYDWIADFIGAVLGVVTYNCLFKRLKKKQSSIGTKK